MQSGAQQCGSPATHMPRSADMVPQVLGSVPVSWFVFIFLQRVHRNQRGWPHRKHNVTAHFHLTRLLG